MNWRWLANKGWSPGRVATAVGMAALGVYVTREAWRDIFFIAATDEESSHILLVPIVAIWMAWVRRIRLRFCAPTGTIVGPLLVAVGWFFYWYGYASAMQSLWHAGAVLVVIGCFLSIAGKQVLFRFLPAFAVLLFLIPVPGILRQAIALPLQTATAATAQAIFETAGLRVERSMNLLTINGVDVAVAEACNGMRMVFALVLVSYAFAFSMPLRNSVRFVILVASLLAAMACNVVRLIPTIWLYGYAERATADHFHSLSGWLMLPIAFVLLLGIVRLLRWALIPVARYNLAYQ